MTGRDAKSFFATGRKARHLQDETTFAGHPDGLQVLARLFTKDRKRTVVDGDLRRHGILHGRELGFDDQRNSVKTLVALAAVLEWAAPLGRAEADRLACEREERWAGSRERDEFGRLRDRRGYSQAKQALMTLAPYQYGYFTRHGRYATSVEDLDPGGRLLRDIAIHVAEESDYYRAWRSTPPGLVFGIAGAQGEFVGWQYVGEAEPPKECAGGTGCDSLLSMRTVHLDPDARERASLVVEEIERLLGEGKHITVTVAEEQELLSPQQAADRLGFSRQHVVRLINAGELEARKLPGSSYWQIPLATVLAFEERSERAGERADAFSRSLDALGAPLE